MFFFYDSKLTKFIPFDSLKPQKKDEIASAIEIEINQILDDIKNVKKRASVTKAFMAVTMQTGQIEKKE